MGTRPHRGRGRGAGAEGDPNSQRERQRVQLALFAVRQMDCEALMHGADGLRGADDGELYTVPLK